MVRNVTPEYRFWEKVDLDFETGCWNWTSFITPSGYGTLTVNYFSMRAHRFSYELFKGKIPEGMVIDHICKNRKCVNPNHLRVVTTRQNVLENSDSPFAKNKAKTHCKNGHPLSGDNLHMSPNGARVCKTCRSETYKTNREADVEEYRRKKRESYHRNRESNLRRRKERLQEFARLHPEEYRRINREAARKQRERKRLLKLNKESETH